MFGFRVPNLSFYRDNFRMTTIFLSGAAVQCLAFHLLPALVATLPTFLLVVSRIINYALVKQHVLHDPSFDGIKVGRLTAQIPHEDSSPREQAADREVVVLVLGARSNQ